MKLCQIFSYSVVHHVFLCHADLPMVNPALNGYQGEQFLADPDEQARSGKRLAAALFDPNGPTSPMRMSTGVMFGSPGAGGSAPPPPAASSTGARLPETEKMHILERTHNKSSRLHNMQGVLRDLTDDDIPKVGQIKVKGEADLGVVDRSSLHVLNLSYTLAADLYPGPLGSPNPGGRVPPGTEAAAS